MRGFIALSDATAYDKIEFHILPKHKTGMEYKPRTASSGKQRDSDRTAFSQHMTIYYLLKDSKSTCKLIKLIKMI